MTERTRLAAAEAWWAFVARVLGFGAGVGILVSQADATEERLWLIFAAVGLCGPVVAQAVATVISAFRSGGTPS